MTSSERNDDPRIAEIAHALLHVVHELRTTGVDDIPRHPPVVAAVSPDVTREMKPLTSTDEAHVTGDTPGRRLDILRDETIGLCTRCKLCRGRNNIVFGVGNPQAKLVFVGEGPGADEDRTGIPFVGKAGQLLTKMIENGMGLSRDDVYICNVVKCRPPNNRDPESDEVAACEPFLKAQLDIIKPKVIVGLGRYATQTLLATKAPLGKLRGTMTTYQGIAFMPTYHPSFLLREPQFKRQTWEDLKAVMRHLGSPRKQTES